MASSLWRLCASLVLCSVGSYGIDLAVNFSSIIRRDFVGIGGVRHGFGGAPENVRTIRRMAPLDPAFNSECRLHG